MRFLLCQVYDKIEENKSVEAEKKKEVDRKPKYISNLLKSAEIRKKEYERPIERKVRTIAQHCIFARKLL